MNQSIKAAAQERYPRPTFGYLPDEYHAFISGATYFQQSSGADEMAEALAFCLGFVDELKVHGITAWSGEEKAIDAIAKYNSFIKKEEDGKEDNDHI